MEKEFHEQKEEVLAIVFQRVSRIERKLKNLEKSLEECERWEVVKHEGDLLKASFPSLRKGLSSISLVDWNTNQEVTIGLDRKKTPQELVQERFKKARKQKGGIPELKSQITKTEELLQLERKKLALLSTLESKEELESFKRIQIPPPKSIKEKLESKSLPYHEFKSKTGIRILVGKNSKANDKVTFVHAHGSDWWLHVQDFPGSHVVIKSSAPDEETLADAMQLALYFSKAKDRGEGEICLTQQKFIRRFGQQLGKVQVSKHKAIFIRSDPERQKRLLKKG